MELVSVCGVHVDLCKVDMRCEQRCDLTVALSGYGQPPSRFDRFTAGIVEVVGPRPGRRKAKSLSY